MGKIVAVCISEKKGTAKQNVFQGELIENHGLKGDAHAGDSHQNHQNHRQVSLLSLEKTEEFRMKGADVQDGAFGENLIVQGIDLRSLVPGTLLRCGSALLEITQIGKKCHSHCEIFKQMGDCIMPREGVFARVLCGGFIQAGDEITVETAYRAAIITVSDKCYAKTRDDESGPLIKKIIENAGFYVTHSIILPDEKDLLEQEMQGICDAGIADLLLSTGGTGFSPRDITPEATLTVAERLVPGIAEAMRAGSLAITGRAMLNRGVSVIRKQTLIINLPGSPKAVQECLGFIIAELKHGLDILLNAKVHV